MDVDGNIRVVREALEKIEAQGEIGTVNIKRCIAYLRTAEETVAKRDDAIDRFRKYVLGLED